MVGPATQEFEIVMAARFLEEGKVYDLNDRAQLNRFIELRKAEIVRGLNDPIAVEWTEKLQREVEPLLRMRLSSSLGYVIDRWVESEKYWHQIPGVIGFQGPQPGLCDRMRNQYDMWKKSSPKEDQDAINNKARHPILNEKDEASAKIRAENDRKSTDKVLGAVDSLSKKQVEQFLAVERARHTGEKLVHHGPDLKFVEHVEQVQKTTPAIPEDMGPHCINPGLNPKIYKRKTGGKHVRE